MDIFSNVAAFVFVLGVMVLFHELGHFLAARYFGVRVESFAFGFGPRLFGFRRGDTDYRVCLLPLGGYVKMGGDSLGEPTGDPDEFLAKPRWQRLIILAMGPLFNFFLAVFLLAGLYSFHFERYAYFEQDAEIAYVAQGSSAERAGLQAGDRVIAVNTDIVEDWLDAELSVAAAVHTTVDVKLERAGRTIELAMPVDADERGVGRAGWHPEAPVILGPASPDMPAAKAGIESGDILTAIDGKPVVAAAEVLDKIKGSEGRELRLTLDRDGERIEASVTPVFDRSTADGDAWRIGVGLREKHDRVVTALSFGEALDQSVENNLQNATMTFRFLGGLIEQRMSPKSLEGPIGIARLSGEAARQGWPYLISLMAMISLQLGIFNLLPIPILDGGQITLLAVESVIRKDVVCAIKERIVQVGLVLIVLLFAFVMYNDILKSLPSS